MNQALSQRSYTTPDEVNNEGPGCTTDLNRHCLHVNDTVLYVINPLIPSRLGNITLWTGPFAI